MRIWYQSIVSPQRMPNYFQALQRHAQSVADPGTEVVVSGTRTGGQAMQYRFYEFWDTRDILENVVTARQQDYDAFAIGNIVDPGMYEAREMLDVPVLGLCETSLLVSCTLGRNFAFIALNDKFIPRLEEKVRQYGLTSRLAGIECMQLVIPQVDSAFLEPARRDAAIEQFLAGARKTVASGAEVLIPAAGGLMALLSQAGVFAVDGAPILDGVAALVKMTEMAVKLRKLTGVTVSRRLLFSQPPADLAELARKAYGV